LKINVDTTLLEAARQIAPMIRAHNDEAERERRLSKPVLAAAGAIWRGRTAWPPITFCRLISSRPMASCLRPVPLSTQTSSGACGVAAETLASSPPSSTSSIGSARYWPVSSSIRSRTPRQSSHSDGSGTISSNGIVPSIAKGASGVHVTRTLSASMASRCSAAPKVCTFCRTRAQ
jgi:hypothetical protein